MLVIPLVVHTHGSVAEALDLVDYVVWAIFLFEYMVKLVLAPYRWQFVKTHVLDLVIVALPLFRPLRALRSLRSVTVMWRSASRVRAILTHHGLHFVLLVVTMAVFAGAGIELSVESNAPGSNIHNDGEALWWAMTTVTTVGYGDHFPVRAPGKGIALVLILIGVGAIGLITASVASFFIEEKSNPLAADVLVIQEQLAAIRELLAHLSNAVARTGEEVPEPLQDVPALE